MPNLRHHSIVAIVRNTTVDCSCSQGILTSCKNRADKVAMVGNLQFLFSQKISCDLLTMLQSQKFRQSSYTCCISNKWQYAYHVNSPICLPGATVRKARWINMTSKVRPYFMPVPCTDTSVAFTPTGRHC